MTLTAVLIIVGLILVNGLFVASEFAIVGAPKASIDRLAQRGHPAARAVRAVLENPRRQDRFIATAQLGITLASLGLGMYGEHVLAEWLAGPLEHLGTGRWVAAHTVASVIAVAILTYFHIVIGEMVPKSVALERAQHTVLWTTPIVRGFELVLYPLVLALNGIGNGLLRIMGIHRGDRSQEDYRTPEELAYLVRETVAGGLLRRSSGQIVQELLEFGALTAGEMMVPRVRVLGLPLQASRDDIQATLDTHTHTRYPVYDRTIDNIIGMVHVKDLLRCLSTGGILEKAYVHPVPYLPGTADVKTLLAAMDGSRSQLAVVLDEHGGTAGIVTVEDLFEEVVGEFGGDPAVLPELHHDAEGRVHVAGTLRLDVVGEAIGVPLEHDEVDTAGGVILALLGRPPRVGDTVTYQGVWFEVVSVEGHGVRQAIVRRAGEPAAAPRPGNAEPAPG